MLGAKSPAKELTVFVTRLQARLPFSFTADPSLSGIGGNIPACSKQGPELVAPSSHFTADRVFRTDSQGVRSTPHHYEERKSDSPEQPVIAGVGLHATK